MAKHLGPAAALMILLLGGCSVPGDGVAPPDLSEGPIERCPAIGKPVPRAECEFHTDALKGVAPGKGVIDAPHPLRRGRVETLQLRVEYLPPPRRPRPPEGSTSEDTAPEDDVFPAEADEEGPEGEPAETPASPDPAPAQPDDPKPAKAKRKIVAYPLKVGQRMSADLVRADGIEVTPLSDRIQTVSPDGVTSWQWQVKALTNTSPQMLYVKTAVVSETSDGRAEVLVPTTREYPVVIDVTWYQRMWDAVTIGPERLKIIGALLAALGVFAGVVAKFGKDIVAAWRSLMETFRRTPPR